MRASSNAMAAEIAALEAELVVVMGDLASLTANVTVGDNVLSSQLTALNTRVTALEDVVDGVNAALGET